MEKKKKGTILETRDMLALSLSLSLSHTNSLGDFEEWQRVKNFILYFARNSWRERGRGRGKKREISTRQTPATEQNTLSLALVTLVRHEVKEKENERKGNKGQL